MLGYLVEKEINQINRAVYKAKKPYTAVIGGSKISTKIGIIESLIDKVDNLIVAGGIAYTFVKAQGGKIGNSLVENDYLDTALRILEKAKKCKEYEPGYLHIDVTYLPKFEKQKYYLFVAINRATRLLYYKVYENKSSENTVEFFKEGKDFLPFYLTHILTDNRLEFTDK